LTIHHHFGFSHFNYNVLQKIFNKLDNQEDISYLENRILNIAPFIMGGPRVSHTSFFNIYNQNLKYPITNSDNDDTILLKTILNIIYSYRQEIEQNLLEKRESYDFTFNDQGKFLESSSDSKLISNSNLGLLLDRHQSKVWGILKDLEEGHFKWGRNYQTILRKMILRMRNLFQNTPLNFIFQFIKENVDKFLLNSFNEEQLFVFDICSEFDKLINEVLAQSKVSEKLGFSKTYFSAWIASYRKNKFRNEFSKYFKFLGYLHTFDFTRIGINNQQNIEEFLNTLEERIFDEMVRRKMNGDTQLALKQIKTIFYFCLSLTVLNNKDPSLVNNLFNNIISRKNPLGFIGLKELSQIIGGVTLLHNQIRDISFSYQLGNVLHYIENGLHYEEKICRKTLELWDDYKSASPATSQKIGYMLHDIYEIYTFNYLKDHKIKSITEKEINEEIKTRPDV
jgi:hypothetical protein